MTEEGAATVAILAGGASSRMGEDKAFLSLGEHAFIDHIIERLQKVFPEVMVVVKAPDKFCRIKALVVQDEVATQCALAGVVTALRRSTAPFTFIVSCDLPFVSLRLVRYMMRFLEGYDAVLPESTRGIEPLCGFYARTALPVLEAHLASGDYDLKHCLKELNVHVIPFRVVYWFDGAGCAFLNVNTPLDASRARAKFAELSQASLTHGGGV